jgi:hypothetical protein
MLYVSNVNGMARAAIVHADPLVRVASRVLEDLDAIADRMVASYCAQVPEYAVLADDVLRLEVRPVSRKVVEAFFTALVAGEEADAEQLPELHTSGRRRLDMGVPLEPMLHVYRIAGRTVWDAIVHAIGPGEERVLAELGASWMDYIDRASSAAAAAYLEASHDRIRHADAQRSAIVQSLLAATEASDVAAVAAEHSTSFADAYAPVVVAAATATTRPERVAELCPRGTLYGLRAGHLLLLVPEEPEPDTLLRAVGADATVACGKLAAPGQSLRDEVRATDLLLRAALAGERTGAFGPGDLLAEQLVSSNSRVAAELDATVGHVLRDHDRSGSLTETLRAYLATGSVPETARLVVIHPNTVVYRLRRVAELTGLDPRVPAQAAVLVLALASAL